MKICSQLTTRQVAIAYGTGEVVGEFSREAKGTDGLGVERPCAKGHGIFREAVCLTNHQGQKEEEGLKSSDCLQVRGVWHIISCLVDILQTL